jgi:hypothetical protein
MDIGSAWVSPDRNWAEAVKMEARQLKCGSRAEMRKGAASGRAWSRICLISSVCMIRGRSGWVNQFENHVRDTLMQESSTFGH